MTIEFDLSDAKSYKEYFRSIAAKNKLLAAESASPFLYGDIEIGQSEAAIWKGRKLWAWPANQARGSGQNDNYFLSREGTIWIGGPCNSEKFEDEDEYYFATERIMKQVLSRIIMDFSESRLAPGFLTSAIQRSDMNISATKFIGCELTFTFADPDGFEYNEDEWH